MQSSQGRIKMHDNKRENKQFKDATKDLSKSEKRRLHDEITGKRFDFWGILNLSQKV